MAKNTKSRTQNTVVIRKPRALPKELKSPARWRDVFMMVVGSAVLLVVLNVAAIMFLRAYSPNRTPRLERAKWEMIWNLKQPVDWIVLGDSSGIRGVVPRILSESLGGRSINLCTTRSMLVVDDAWMLDGYLELFDAPHGVLIVHTYETWGQHQREMVPGLAKIPLPWGFWREREPRLTFDPDEELLLFLARYVPLYADNRSLARVFQYPWKLVSFNLGIEQDGYMPVMSAHPDLVMLDSTKHLANIKNQTFQLSHVNVRALEHIRELAETHGFTVYIVNGPIYEELYREPIFAAYFKQVRDSLRAFASSSPRIRYIMQEPMTFPKDQMENVDHVIASASVRYTQRLADEILAVGR